MKSHKNTDDPILVGQHTTLADSLIIAANRTQEYLPLLRNKKVGVVANQTSVIFKKQGHTHLVDSLLSLQVDVKKVFAPEHGFRGEADAGEAVNDGLDTKTGLPLISLYGKNKKPSDEQLQGLDVVLFDIQDVGVRFYTYIATLQLVMEACAKNNIPVIVLDRPNPNASYVDGPTMEAKNTSFLGMTTIPLVYGMTIGEYAQMLNGEGWLEANLNADITVIPLKNYTHNTDYHLPIRPSPNLPNDKSINLYPSLGLFEGTNVNAGRGTEFQFQRYGASFLNPSAYDFNYVPKPNFGSKSPKEEGKTCYGKDLSNSPKLQRVTLAWLLDAHKNSADKTKFFLTDSFTKHSGTEKLQQQIEAGLSEDAIKKTWQTDLDAFRKIRIKYLMYE
ncbi:MAG: hypothetical protein ACJAUO_002612 [Sediminicola sp.]|jgi:uncharacterized protein YbbC (DUF1343 family)